VLFRSVFQAYGGSVGTIGGAGTYGRLVHPSARSQAESDLRWAEEGESDADVAERGGLTK